MVSLAKFYGKSLYITTGSNFQLAFGLPRVLVVTATSAGVKLLLGQSQRYRLGAPVFIIHNAGSNAFDIRNASNTDLFTVNPGQLVEVVLVANGGSVGQWGFKEATVSSAPSAAPVRYHYLMGGKTTTANVVSTQTYRYNQQLDVTTTMSTMPSSPTAGKYLAASFEYGAAAILCGGDAISPYTESFSTHKYDPDVWSSETAIPGGSGGFYAHCGANISNKGYIFGGASGGTGPTDALNRRAYEFDSGTWTAKTSRPSGRRSWYSAACPISSGILLVGGSVGPNTNCIDQYYLDTYTAKTSRPVPFMIGNGCAPIGDVIYSFCGVYDLNGPGNSLLSNTFAYVYKYDFATDTWTTVTNFIEGQRAGLSAASFNNKIQILGGYIPGVSGNTKRSSIVEYNPATDSYATRSNLTTTVFDCHNQQQALIP